MSDATTKSRRCNPVTLVVLGVVLFAAALLLRLAGLSASPVRLDPRQVRLFSPPMQLPAFTLVDHQGQLFSKRNLQGHWTLALIGFTYCPDVCPLGLAKLADLYQLFDTIGPAVKPPTFVFLSVDPFRDTGEILGEYVTFYRPEFIGVTGAPDEISRLISGIGLYYAYADPGGTTIYKDVLHRPEPARYSVVHSAELLLINPEGELVAMMIPPFSAADILSLYTKLCSKYGG